VSAQSATVEQARAAFDGGDAEAAAAICRALVQADAHDGDAHYLLGLTLAAQGDPTRAAASLSKAAELLPANATLHCDLGVVLRRMGRSNEAVAIYQKAISIDPGLADGYYNLANLLHAAGRADQAVDIYKQCLRVAPDHVNAANNIGLALIDAGQAAEAAGYFRALIADHDAAAILHNNLGNALRALDDLPGAIVSYRRALELEPNYADAHSNLGIALNKSGDVQGALACLQHAVALNPANVVAQINIGSTLYENGELDAAIAVMEKAVELLPDDAGLRWNLALAYLAAGRLREGWAEYEWRWKKSDFTTPRQNFPQPQWDGGDLQGRKILLHAEQGLGDTIQFIRYAPLVQARGGQVFFVCQPELKRLLGSAPGIDVLAASGEEVPMFDVHLPLLSLPHVLGTTLETIPAATPYLAAPPAAITATAALPESDNLKIGLVWSGSATHKLDHKRSLALKQLVPLFDVDSVDFISLQVGPQRRDIVDLGLGVHLFDGAAQLRDFADTAALIAELDLVISVDTAVAHLAGAMAKPVWVMLPHVPDWRWLQTGDDSPWYPTMKLFRQSAPGAWPEVIAAVRRALIDFAGPQV